MNRMEHIPHTPEVIRDMVQWDTHNWYKTLLFWEKHAELHPGMKALGIGEREGGLSLWLALRGLHVTCTDYNSFPPATQALHQKYGVSHLITYRNEDATKLRLEDGVFDVVVIKSVLGALSSKERQQQAIDEFYRVLKPGGVLLLAENTKATAFHAAVRKRFAPWSSYWRYLSLKGDMDLFQKFGEHRTAAFGFWGFLGKGRLEPLTRLADTLTEPLVPRTWKYIMAGMFKK